VTGKTRISSGQTYEDIKCPRAAQVWGNKKTEIQEMFTDEALETNFHKVNDFVHDW